MSSLSLSRNFIVSLMTSNRTVHCAFALHSRDLMHHGLRYLAIRMRLLWKNVPFATSIVIIIRLTHRLAVLLADIVKRDAVARCFGFGRKG